MYKSWREKKNDFSFTQFIITTRVILKDYRKIVISGFNFQL